MLNPPYRASRKRPLPTLPSPPDSLQNQEASVVPRRAGRASHLHFPRWPTARRLALGNPPHTKSQATGFGFLGARCGQPSSLPASGGRATGLRSDSRPSGTSSLSPLPSLRESLFLTPTRPLGLAFYKMDLSFYKRQKEPLAQAALASCPGKKNP